MDDATKLSPKLAGQLLSLLKAQTGAELQPDALLQTLTDEQKQTAAALLADPQGLQKLLKSPVVRTLLRTMGQTPDNDGTTGA